MRFFICLLVGLLAAVACLLWGCVDEGDDPATDQQQVETGENSNTAGNGAKTQVDANGEPMDPAEALEYAARNFKPYAPEIDPAEFVPVIDNPFWPLVSGMKYTYEAEDETVVVEVLEEKRTIMGVGCTVARDTVYVDGEIEEDTYDWFAQDAAGNVWYFGEDSWAYDHGEKKSHAGSWEAGVDGALPGIVMHAEPPAAGEPYFQEYYPGEAMDMAELVSTDETVTVPLGTFEHCRKYREFSALEPGAVEYKYYAAGIGVVLETNSKGGARLELVSMESPAENAARTEAGST